MDALIVLLQWLTFIVNLPRIKEKTSTYGFVVFGAGKWKQYFVVLIVNFRLPPIALPVYDVVDDVVPSGFVVMAEVTASRGPRELVS